MIDEQSSATGHDYASDHSVIGAGDEVQWNLCVHLIKQYIMSIK